MIIEIVPTDVYKYAPELSGTDPDTLELYLDLARQHISSRVWGKKYVTAVLLFTAHILTELAEETSTEGVITSESLGDMSVSYAVSEATLSRNATHPWGTTIYGRMLLALRATNSLTPFVV